MKRNIAAINKNGIFLTEITEKLVMCINMIEIKAILRTNCITNITFEFIQLSVTFSHHIYFIKIGVGD